MKRQRLHTKKEKGKNHCKITKNLDSSRSLINLKVQATDAQPVKTQNSKTPSERRRSRRNKKLSYQPPLEVNTEFLKTPLNETCFKNSSSLTHNFNTTQSLDISKSSLSSPEAKVFGQNNACNHFLTNFLDNLQPDDCTFKDNNIDNLEKTDHENKNKNNGVKNYELNSFNPLLLQCLSSCDSEVQKLFYKVNQLKEPGIKQEHSEISEKERIPSTFETYFKRNIMKEALLLHKSCSEISESEKYSKIMESGKFSDDVHSEITPKTYSLIKEIEETQTPQKSNAKRTDMENTSEIIKTKVLQTPNKLFFNTTYQRKVPGTPNKYSKVTAKHKRSVLKTFTGANIKSKLSRPNTYSEENLPLPNTYFEGTVKKGQSLPITHLENPVEKEFSQTNIYSEVVVKNDLTLPKVNPDMSIKDKMSLTNLISEMTIKEKLIVSNSNSEMNVMDKPKCLKLNFQQIITEDPNIFILDEADKTTTIEITSTLGKKAFVAGLGLSTSQKEEEKNVKSILPEKNETHPKLTTLANGHNTEQSNPDQSSSERMKCSYQLKHSNYDDNDQKHTTTPTLIPTVKPLESLNHIDHSCRPECSSCNKIFGLQDSPFHIAHIKNPDKQKACLENATHLIGPHSCLCVSCYQVIENRTSIKNQTKRTCIIMSCEQTASHIFNSRWMSTLKSILLINKINFRVQTNEEKALHKTPFCNAHYDQMLIITQCHLCGNRTIQKFKLQKAVVHEYQLILDADNIPVTIKHDILICKACHIYLLLRRDKSTKISSELDKHCEAAKTRILNNNALKTKELERIKLAKDEINLQKKDEDNQLLMFTSLPPNKSDIFTTDSSFASKPATLALDASTTSTLAIETPPLTTITAPTIAALTKATEDVKLTVTTAKKSSALTFKRKRQPKFPNKHPPVPRTKKHVVNQPILTTNCIKHTMPDHKLTIPVHKSIIPDVKPTTPVEKSTILVNKATTQVDKSTILVYEPIVPVNKSTSSVDNPTTQVDKSISPVDKPTVADHKPLYNKSLVFSPVLRPLFSSKCSVHKTSVDKPKIIVDKITTQVDEPMVADHKPLYNKSLVFSPVLRSFYSSKCSVPKTTGQVVKPMTRVDKHTIPVHKSTTQVDKSTILVDKPTISVDKHTTQIVESSIPVDKPTTPVDESTIPVDIPMIPVHKPTSSIVKPTVSADIPTNRVVKPTTPVDKPMTPIDEPAIPVDESTTPVDEPTISVDNPTSPVDEPTFLVDISTTPVDESTIPVDKPKTPVVESTTPVKEPRIPVDKPMTPIDEPAIPVDESTTPVDEPIISVDNPTSPVDEPTFLVDISTTPVDESTIPVDKPKTPVVESMTPVKKPRIPVDKHTTPVDEPTIADHNQLYDKLPAILPVLSSVPKKPAKTLEPVSPIKKLTQLQTNQSLQSTLDSRSSTSPLTEFSELSSQRSGPSIMSAKPKQLIKAFEKLKRPYPSGIAFINFLLNMETSRNLGNFTVENNNTVHSQQTCNTATSPSQNIHQFQRISLSDNNDNNLTCNDYLSDKCVPSDDHNKTDSLIIPVNTTFKSCSIPKQKSISLKDVVNKPSQSHDSGDCKKQAVALRTNATNCRPIVVTTSIITSTTTSTIISTTTSTNTISITTTEASSNIVSTTSPVFSTIAEEITVNEFPITTEKAATATNPSDLITAVADSTTSIVDTKVSTITDTVTINSDKSDITSSIDDNTTDTAVEESTPSYNSIAVTMITSEASDMTNSTSQVSSAIDTDSVTAITTTVTVDTNLPKLNTESSTITNAITTDTPTSSVIDDDDSFTTINATIVTSDITTIILKMPASTMYNTSQLTSSKNTVVTIPSMQFPAAKGAILKSSYSNKKKARKRISIKNITSNCGNNFTPITSGIVKKFTAKQCLSRSSKVRQISAIHKPKHPLGLINLKWLAKNNLKTSASIRYLWWK